LQLSVLTMITNAILSLGLISSLILAPLAVAQDLIPADKDVKDPSLLSIGPIGVRVKTDHIQPRHPRSESDRAIVQYVFENSLAEGKLEIGDIITGINGHPFQKNFTAKLAQEINKSEGTTGKISLNIQRDDKKINVPFQLKPIGSYSKKWPYECSKSSRILQDACDWLVAHQQDNGRFEKQNTTTFVLSSVSGLAMLGCDPKRYQKPLQKLVEFHLSYLKKHTNAEGHYENGSLTSFPGSRIS